MGLLQITISDAQLRTPSGEQAWGRVVGQHAGGTDFSAQKSPRSGKTFDSSPAAKEWRLIQRALAGDPDALSPIFVHYRSKLLHAAFSLLRNKEDAEDALLEGLVNAYIHLDSFQGRSLFSTWLTRIVMNAALMALRRKSARPEASLEECQDGELDDWPAWVIDHRPNPEQACAATEAKQVVERHIEQLHVGKDANFEHVIPKISQDTLAEMVGTTWPRISFFMKKFKKLGFVRHNDGLTVHSSLINFILYD